MMAPILAWPDGTQVDWNGWGLIDVGFVTTNSRGEREVVWAGTCRQSEVRIMRATGLWLAEPLYGPFGRDQQQYLDETHDKLLCGPVDLFMEEYLR